MELADFFQRYAVASLGPEPEAIAAFYEASFLAAGPAGGAAFHNDQAFLDWLRQVHEFNARTGMTSMEVVDLEDARVGGGYSLATVTWAAGFRAHPEPIRFRISYLLRHGEDGPKVAAFISHEDQEAAMRAHGLL